jgi:ATP-binding protein involved in chromosome partitioning
MTSELVLAALAGVHDPDLQTDIVSLKFVKHVEVTDGRAALTIELSSPSVAARDEVRERALAAVAAVAGITSVDVAMAFSVRSASAPEHGKPPLPGVKNVIAVGAGKGGVGKTTVAVNLAVSLSKLGARVGILDGDIYGPNVPIMFGLQAQLQMDGKMIRPAEKYGIQIVSMGFLAQEEAPMIWRGPMLHSAIQQFCRDVGWKALDYLIVDMPPGTGDVALSLSQTVPAAGAIVVTTPQQVSLADSKRAVRMYQKLNIPTLGLVENMSHFVCPSCSHESDIFGKGGGEGLAAELSVPFLGRIPIYEPIRIGGDTGVPVTIGEPKSVAAQAFRAAAERLAAQIAVANFNAGNVKRPIPLTQVR